MGSITQHAVTPKKIGGYRKIETTPLVNSKASTERSDILFGALTHVFCYYSIPLCVLLKVRVPFVYNFVTGPNL